VTTVSNIENVAIVALDCDSPFRVSHDQESANAAESGNTPSSSSGTPTPETFTPGATPAISMNTINMSGTSKSNEVFEPETGESYALLVNHRVAYSHRRELASHGILLNRDMPLDEEWMLPLASAYLLQVPVKTSAPSREHLSLETQAVEVTNTECADNPFNRIFMMFALFLGPSDTLTIVTDGFKCSSGHCQAIPRSFLS
jgi:hypothetical protein